MRNKTILTLLFVLMLVLVTCSEQPKYSQRISPALDSNTLLTIWWTKGFFLEEDETLQKLIRTWENQTKVKVKLTFLSDDESLKKTLKALENNNLPDIIYNRRLEFAVNPKAAWEGKVAEVSDLIEPIKSLYTPSALQSVYLYNSQTQELGYYAVPLQQQTLHIHYWEDLLNEAGFQDSDIPQDWEQFWKFWEQVQDRLVKQGKTNIYGVGLSFSAEANDSFYAFEQVLAAYNIQLLDQQGNLQINQPGIRQGMIKALNWFTQFYKNGYAPEDSINWLPEDNNVNFLNRRLVMTINPTLSIPASQKNDNEYYQQKIKTIAFPNKPNGEPMKNFVSIKQVITFPNSPHHAEAKNFLSFLVQPKNLSEYLKGSQGRYFPVMPELLSDPFWNNSNDPHLSVAAQQFNSVVPLPSILYPFYSQIFAENIWGKAIEQVVVEGKSPEAATDTAIERIRQIFANWKN